EPGRAHRARADLARGAGGRSRRVRAPGARAAVPAGCRVKLALFGFGRMARAAAAHAAGAGHQIGAVFTARNTADVARLLPGHDAAIDFSAPDAVPAHVDACAGAGVPLVEGTTGWQAREAEVRRVVDERGGALVYGANFSIGVNLFYQSVARSAALFHGLAGYEPVIEEAHRAGQRDAPSCTAARPKAT